MAEAENLHVIQEASVENTVVLEAQSLKKRVKFDEVAAPNFEFGDGELELLTQQQIEEIQQRLDQEMQTNESETILVSHDAGAIIKES